MRVVIKIKVLKFLVMIFHSNLNLWIMEDRVTLKTYSMNIEQFAVQTEQLVFLINI